MKNKIIFLGLIIAQNSYSLSRGEEHTIYLNLLEKNGNNVKVCLKLMKQNYKFTDRDKEVIEITFKSYLNTLANFYDFMKESRKASEEKK